MKLRLVLFGSAILFASLIGCQQTEKITTKIDTVKLITTKYDTVVLNKKDTVVIVNNDTIYISNNPTASSVSDGEITGTVTIGNNIYTIDFTINGDNIYQYYKEDNAEYYDYYDTANDNSISYFNIWRSKAGSKDNYIWIEDFTPQGGGQIDFAFTFHKEIPNTYGITTSYTGVIYPLNSNSFIVSNFNFNGSTSDLSFNFEFNGVTDISVTGSLTQSSVPIEFVGSYKGKVYQNLDNN